MAMAHIRAPAPQVTAALTVQMADIAALLDSLTSSNSESNGMVAALLDSMLTLTSLQPAVNQKWVRS